MACIFLYTERASSTFPAVLYRCPIAAVAKVTSPIGSNNIDVGNQGAAGDAGIIRIGTAGTQAETFIAGIVNSKLTGNEVVITPSGRLGVKASSERYKTDIAPMGSVSVKLGYFAPYHST